DGVFASKEITNGLPDMVLAATALAAGRFVLECRITARDVLDRPAGVLRQRRSPQIRVEEHPRRVDYGTQAPFETACKGGPRLLDQCRRPDFPPTHRPAQLLLQVFAPIQLAERDGRGRYEKRIHRRRMAL